MVIASYSTAIGLAILFDKPILIITSDEISANRYLVGFVENMAHSLGVLPVNIDQVDEIDFVAAAAVYTERRVKYINNFIKRKGSPVKPYWEIVIDTLKKHDQPRAINESGSNTNLGAKA